MSSPNWPPIAVWLALILPLATGCIPDPADTPKVNFGGPSQSSPVGEPVVSKPAPAPSAGVTVEEVPATSGAEASRGETQLQASPVIALRPGPLWIVVKNLQVRNEGINTDITADWEVVQGSPDPDADYVLRVSDGDSGGQVERYVDFDVHLGQESGTFSGGIRGDTFAAKGLYAILGKRITVKGEDELEPVSGKAPLGGESDATPRPAKTAASPARAGEPVIAASVAGGKPIALANPRREPRQFGSPRGGWSVDFHRLADLRAGERYDWVIEDANGNRVVIDVTTELILPTRPKVGTFTGTPTAASRVSGAVTMFIERKPIGDGEQASGEVVSNTVGLEDN